MGETIYKLNNGYSIKVITDMGHFNNLRSSWDGLLEGQKLHVPFLCFDWFRIWLEHFLNANELLVLLLYKHNRLLAIAPFMIHSESFKRLIRVRKISLIGNVHSPIKNFIFGDLSEEVRTDCLIHILHFLHDNSIEWDVIEIDAIPLEDNSFHILSAAIAKLGLKSRQYNCFGDWYLDGINYSSDEYVRRLPKTIISEIRRRKKRLQEIGNVRIEIGTNEINFDHHMDLYYQVRQKSWKNPESNPAFLCGIRNIAAKKGWLRCGFLFVDSLPIAAQIRLVSNSIVYFMEALHDSNYNKFGPGNILRLELLKHYIDVDRVNQIDQGRGDDPYKKHWSPKRRERKGITIFNRNLKGQFLSFLMTTLLPIIKKHHSLLSAKNKVSGYLKTHREN